MLSQSRGQINSFVWDKPVSNSDLPNGDAASHPEIRPAAPVSRGFPILVVALFAEAALMVFVFAWLLFELLTERPVSYPTALALIAVAGVAAIWVSAIAVNALRRKGWVRAAAFTWQILQFAVAIGSFQGAGARPDIGWALLVPAVVVISLLLTPGAYPSKR